MTMIVAHGRITEHVAGPALNAFAGILETGVDMLEFDVRRTADGVLVVTHDDVSTQRYAGLDASAPAMQDLLELTRGRVALDIELKDRGCAADAIALALRTHDPADLLVTSFDPDVVNETMAVGADVRTGYIVETREAFAVAASLRSDYLVPSVALVRAGILAEATARGLKSLVWTVNDEADMATIVDDERVAGLITDRPDVAVRVREQRRVRG